MKCRKYSSSEKIDSTTEKLDLLNIESKDINYIEGAAIDDDCNKQSTNDEPKHNGAQVSRSTRYQCKPDFSCWNFLPSPVHEKWTKLKKWVNNFFQVSNFFFLI